MTEKARKPLNLILFTLLPALLLGAVTVATIFAEVAPGSSAGATGSQEQSATIGQSGHDSPAALPLPVSTRPEPGQLEILALREAYPSRITAAEFRDGEWALQMDGVWYYWSQGRLLPANLRAEWEKYAPVRFYRYEMGPLVVPEVPAETAARLRQNNPANSVDTSVRFNGFLDSLYEVDSLRRAELKMVNVKIMGWGTRVHPMLVEPIRRINRRLGMLMKADPEILEFVRTIQGAHGYNWRNIANTVRRSYHSYGISVDIVPHTYGKLVAYWLWAAESGFSEWWAIPASGRWLFPEKMVQIFEEEGFIWGARWMMYDNMHFEYRPEVILMSKWAAASRS